MFKLSYYAKGRIVHYIIHVVMIVFLIVSLFPIGWMFFNSLKDNTEILSGRIPLNRASNDCAKLKMEGNVLWAFGADGSISKLDRRTLSKLGYFSLKSSGTSFSLDDKYVWVSTAGKGLAKIDKNTLNVAGRMSYALTGIDENRIASTVVLAGDDRVWVAFDYKGVQKVIEFAKDGKGPLRLIDLESELSPFTARAMLDLGGSLWVGGNGGLLEVSLKEGRVVNSYVIRATDSNAQVLSMVSRGGIIYLGTSRGLFEFSLAERRVIRSVGVSGGLASDHVNDLTLNGDVMLLGTGGGLTVMKLATGDIRNYTELFAFIEGGKPNDKKLVPSEVFSVAYDFKKVFLGTTKGRMSVLDLGENRVSATGVLGEGQLIVRWRNYVDMWKNIDFGLYLRNSVLVCGISTLIAMILATLAAYALARFNFPGSRSFSLAILATQMIPAIMYLIPIYSTFVKITEWTGIPMKGTYFGIILVYSAFFVPFSIWILRGFFAAIPRELEEAARIDGCSPIQVFWYVVLPLAVPGIIATGVYIFLTAWDELMFAWVLTNADTMTIPVGIRNFVGNYQNRFDLMMAAASVATIPVLVLFFLLQKYIVKGLTAGAVKG